jgi:hypothetical protein
MTGIACASVILAAVGVLLVGVSMPLAAAVCFMAGGALLLLYGIRGGCDG